MTEAATPDLTTLTVQLLSAYVSNNTVPSGELPGLIASTRTALASKSAPEAPAEAIFTPVVTVRKSLASRDHILSMIDGKPYKSLKRHLSSHGLTPSEYRIRYKLASDYPMVAPGYSEHRRAVAQRLGLGRRKSAPESAVGLNIEEAAAPVEVPQTPAATAGKTKRPAKASASKRGTGTRTRAVKSAENVAPNSAEATKSVTDGSNTGHKPVARRKLSIMTDAKPLVAADVDAPKIAVRRRRVADALEHRSDDTPAE